MNAYLAEAPHNQLDDRDLAILRSLERFRLLTTRHIQHLHFHGHQSLLAGARACTRTLQRLHASGFISPLERRIGGARRGSASYVWHLAAAGERLLRIREGGGRRRRYLEPGYTFLDHTLAVNDVAVGVIEAARDRADLHVDALISEPRNWRQYLGAHGETAWLRPDLYVVTSGAGDDGKDDAWEAHSFLEIDRGTEHLPRIQAKCWSYASYYATGRYQAEHGVFPAVIWLSDDPARRRALRGALSAAAGLPALFRVTSPADYLSGLPGGGDGEIDNQPSTQEGGPTS